MISHSLPRLKLHGKSNRSRAAQKYLNEAALITYCFAWLIQGRNVIIEKTGGDPPSHKGWCHCCQKYQLQKKGQ
jgi:hypothetical protein